MAADALTPCGGPAGRRRLDDLVVDALVVESLLDPPACVDVVVDEGEREAVQVDRDTSPPRAGAAQPSRAVESGAMDEERCGSRSPTGSPMSAWSAATSTTASTGACSWPSTRRSTSCGAATTCAPSCSVARARASARARHRDLRRGRRRPRRGRPRAARGRGGELAQRVAYGWRELEVPVIAAMHGACLGGGLQIALGADVRIAAPDTQLSVMEIVHGLIPDMSITQTLPRLVGDDVARELVYTGRKVGANEASSSASSRGSRTTRGRGTRSSRTRSPSAHPTRSVTPSGC